MICHGACGGKERGGSATECGIEIAELTNGNNAFAPVSDLVI